MLKHVLWSDESAWFGKNGSEVPHDMEEKPIRTVICESKSQYLCLGAAVPME